MPERRITRYKGESITIFGPATIRVDRRVTLTIEAPRETRVARTPRTTSPHARPITEPLDTRLPGFGTQFSRTSPFRNS